MQCNYTKQQFTDFNCKNSQYYLIGIFISATLTILSFFTVKLSLANKNISEIVLTIFAILQAVTHLICFLHLNASPQKRWHTVAVLFTAIIAAILIIGSLWIMRYLNHNLMVHSL